MERTKRVRIGVVGAGLIGQVEHIPNLRRLEKLYEIVGIADASADMRRELESRGHAATAPISSCWTRASTPFSLPPPISITPRSP